MTYDEFLADPIYGKINNVIYKFKNKINGKIYIGQTTTNIRKRVIEHVTTSKPWTKARKGYFQRALYKYGFENFEFSIIEKCSDKNTLNIREIYWIGYYKSDQKEFGYNMTPGGEGNTNSEFNKKCVERLIAANTGRHQSEQTKELLRQRHKQKWQNPEFRAKHLEHTLSLSKNASLQVVQLDYDYNVIATYDSIKQVSKLLYGKVSGSLSRNLKNNKNGFKKNGFLWMTKSDFEKRKDGDYQTN